MRQIGPPVRAIAIVSCVIALVAFIVVLLFNGYRWSELLVPVLRVGIAFSALGVFWFAYVKWLWRIRFFRLFGWLSPVPDLNGRWEGTVQRKEGEPPRPFVIEVVQTYTTLRFRTFSQHSTGQSIAVAISKDDEANIFGIVAAWQTTTRALTRTGTPSTGGKRETFHGTSHWRIEYVDNPGYKGDQMRIVDRYFTERSTSGRVVVTRVGKKLTNGFQTNAS